MSGHLSPPPRHRWTPAPCAIQGLAALALWGALALPAAAQFSDDVEGRFDELEQGRQGILGGGDGVPDGEQDFNNDEQIDGLQDLDNDGVLDGQEDNNGDSIPDGQQDLRSLEPKLPSPTPQGQSPLGPAVGEAVKAVEEQLNYKADVQRAFDTEEVLELEGNVLITYQGSKFFADYVRVNDREKVFYGVGNAKLVTPDRTIEGESFWYDYEREDFLIESAHGFVLASGIGEPLYFKSRVARGNLRDFKLINTILTTCEPDERQEWHIKAGMVKVMQDHKVRLRNAIFFIMGVPVFWFPYYEVNLEETPVIVEVQKNRTEGVVVRVKYNYLYEPERFLWGSLTTTYRSRLGFQLETDHRYALHGYQWDGTLKTRTEFLTDAKGINTAYSYQAGQRFEITKDISGNVNFSQNSTLNQQAETRTENSAVGINLSRQTQGGDNTTFAYNFTQQKLTTTNASSTARLSHTHDFSKSLKMNAQASYTSNGGTAGLANDQRLELTANVTGDQSGPITWRADYHQTLDPDGNRAESLNQDQLDEGGGNQIPDPADPGNDTGENLPPPSKLRDPDDQSQLLHKLPEIHVGLRPGALGDRKNLLGIENSKFDITLAHYVQDLPDDKIQTLFAELDTGFRRSWAISDTTRAEANMGYRQSFTGTGDALYTVSPGASISRKESNNLEQNLRWTYNDTEGASPITNQTGGGNSSNISYDLNYRTKKLTWGVNTGRNMKDHTWSPLTLRSTWTPNPGIGDFSITFSTGYDLEGGDLRPFVWQAQWTDFESLKTAFNFTYDYKTKQIQQLNNQTTWLIRKDLDAEFRLSYDTVGTERSILQDLSLTKRFDCTYMQLTYRSQGDMFLLQAGINAFGSTAIGYGLNAANQLSNPFSQFGENFSANPGGFSGFGTNIGSGGFSSGF